MVTGGDTPYLRSGARPREVTRIRGQWRVRRRHLAVRGQGQWPEESYPTLRAVRQSGRHPQPAAGTGKRHQASEVRRAAERKWPCVRGQGQRPGEATCTQGQGRWLLRNHPTPEARGGSWEELPTPEARGCSPEEPPGLEARGGGRGGATLGAVASKAQEMRSYHTLKVRNGRGKEIPLPR